MPRVLLCHQPTDGGVARHLEDLAIGLRKRGYETVLCGPALPRDLPDGTPHVHLDLRREIAPRSDLAAVAALERVLGDLHPDLVHAHSSKAGAIVRIARAMHPGVPVVYTPHGYAFAGHFSRPAERLAYRAAEMALALLTSRVVCVCEAEAALARSIGPARRVRVVHNGVGPAPPGQPDEQLQALAHGGPVIGALTLLRPGKGLETLIDATPALLARHPSARIAIVGEGPDLETLRARARLRGVADAVNFLGACPDPLAALRGMDVLCHPSWAEALPYVILEAMSIAKPIVATDVGGIGEAIQDGESGLLVAPRQADALADALARLLEAPELAGRLGEGALRKVRACFTREAMIGRLVEVYDELVRSPQDTMSVGRAHPETTRSSLSPPMSGGATR